MMEKLGVSNEDLKTELTQRLQELESKVKSEEFIKESSAATMCDIWAEIRSIEEKIQSLK